ncbi:MAG: diguanylate cyclase [Acidobacteriales bacterium]|nr:diguanylate cyclase [Candidatus Koribacter versatilis]MBI3646050.1 diguanylate cyclase [Terriglobales bacterium]
MFSPTPAEIQGLIAHVDQAIYNHERWYDDLVTTLVCRLSYDEKDVDDEAFRKCRFGQWLYGDGERMLREHPSFPAIEGQHKRMHQLAARLLRNAAAGTPTALGDYEVFASTLRHMRLEASTLKRELEDLRSNLDPLTGANNRIHLLTFLRGLQALVKRQVMPCSVVMVDLDHFKAINDTHGHLAGDRVLVATARYAMNHLRPYDKVFRYGGEEFVVCMQNAGVELALLVIDRLREGLAKTPIYHNEVLTHVTASCGIAAVDPEVSVEESIERADQAMYTAKAAGRNCSRTWESSHPAD